MIKNSLAQNSSNTIDSKSNPSADFERSKSENTSISINRVISDEQVEAVLKTMLLNKPVEVLKTIARMGRNSISWVYVRCTLTGEKRSTFVSYSAFSDAFWMWLESAQLMALALWKRIQIARVIYSSIVVGCEVYHTDLGWCEVVEKTEDAYTDKPHFWVTKGDQLHKIDPLKVKEFLW